MPETRQGTPAAPGSDFVFEALDDLFDDLSLVVIEIELPVVEHVLQHLVKRSAFLHGHVHLEVLRYASALHLPPPPPLTTAPLSLERSRSPLLRTRLRASEARRPRTDRKSVV